MATVHLPSLLRELADGNGSVDIGGATVGELVGELERRFPTIAGRITDETGTLRRHVKVFVNGSQVELDSAVGAGDEVRILPAISGGAR